MPGAIVSSVKLAQKRLIRPTDNEVGFRVQAADDLLGKVEYVALDGSYIVVDTAPWIFGRRAVVPSAAVAAIDPRRKRVVVDLTKDEIEQSPQWDEERGLDEECLREVRSYYGRLAERRPPGTGALPRSASAGATGSPSRRESEHERTFAEGLEDERSQPESEPKGRFSEGLEEIDDTEQKRAERSFAEGLAASARTDDEPKGTFAEGLVRADPSNAESDRRA